MIPVPYTLLSMGSGILTSNLVQRKMKGWLNNHERIAEGPPSQKHDFDSEASRFGIELLLLILGHQNTKQAIRKLIKELQYYKGTVLVDVKGEDGTEVLIKL